MNKFDRWRELLNDFFKKGRGLIDEFELLIYRLLEFLERLPSGCRSTDCFSITYMFSRERYASDEARRPGPE